MDGMVSFAQRASMMSRATAGRDNNKEERPGQRGEDSKESLCIHHRINL
jgi:hypothetical protein